MKLITFFLLVISSTQPLLADQQERIIEGNNRFAHELFLALHKHEPSENLVISPLSISSSLAMATLIAEGETKLEMCKALHLLPSNILIDKGFLEIHRFLKSGFAAEEEPVHLNLTSAIWMQSGLHAVPYLPSGVAHFWEEGIHYSDFLGAPELALKEINEWADNETNGLVPELLSKGSINSLTRMVLVNTIYLRAPWKFGFDPEMTYEDYFCGIKEKVQKADYMQKRERLALAQTDEYQVLAIPFKESLSTKSQLALVLLLPRVGKDLEELLEMPLRHLDFQNKLVDLHLPKFEISFSTSLKKTLQHLGMTLPFSEKGGFLIDGQRHLITDVVHQATLKLDEGGVLAAAATASLIGTTAWEEPHPFIANRPFAFKIIDLTTKSTLFMGCVENIDVD